MWSLMRAYRVPIAKLVGYLPSRRLLKISYNMESILFQRLMKEAKSLTFSIKVIISFLNSIQTF